MVVDVRANIREILRIASFDFAIFLISSLQRIKPVAIHGTLIVNARTPSTMITNGIVEIQICFSVI